MRSAKEIAEARIPFPRMCAQIYKDELRDMLQAAQVEAMEWMREEAAKRAETCFPKAHTYASENADVYRAQDDTQALIGRLTRAIELPPLLSASAP